MKKQKLEALEREMKLEEDKLIAQMEYARYEHETETLREQLRQREASREQQKSVWENKERQMEEMLKQEHDRRRRECSQPSQSGMDSQANLHGLQGFLQGSHAFLPQRSRDLLDLPAQ